jgi:hypothetical protein
MNMKRSIILSNLLLMGLSATLFAQSNIDNTVPNKHAWGENVGWTNWRGEATPGQGVLVGPFVMSGFIWAENIGWINTGDGTPGGVCAGLPCYANINGTDFGVNISADGTLHGMAWAENVGWINFDGGAMANPAQPARILCADGPDQPFARLTGFVWGENIGWVNLSSLEGTKFVALTAAATPLLCDLNEDGDDNGLDIHLFVDLLLLQEAPTWRDICAGDVEAVPDHTIDPGDVAPFVNCLLSKP